MNKTARILLATMVLTAAGCVAESDPDQRFACLDTSDCLAGWVCVPVAGKTYGSCVPFEPEDTQILVDADASTDTSTPSDFGKDLEDTSEQSDSSSGLPDADGAQDVPDGGSPDVPSDQEDTHDSCPGDLPTDLQDSVHDAVTIDVEEIPLSDSSPPDMVADVPADIAPADVDYTPIALTIPDSFQETEPFFVEVTVHNLGTDDGVSDPVSVELVLSPDDTGCTPGDDLELSREGIIEVAGPVLADSQASGSKTVATLLGGASPGTYYVYVKMVPSSEIDVNTSNYEYRHPTTVEVTPFTGKSVVFETYPTANPDDLHTTVEVLHDDLERVHSSWGDTSEKANGYDLWTGNLLPGDYFVHISSESFCRIGAYSIIYYTTTATYTAEEPGMDHDDPDAYEPDDDSSLATPLLEDVQQNHTITDVPLDYDDWFSVTIP